MVSITVRRGQTKQWFRQANSTQENVVAVVVKAIRLCSTLTHIKPSTKKAKVSRLVDCAFNKTIILLEIRKCVVLCANCHRKYHYKHARKTR